MSTSRRELSLLFLGLAVGVVALVGGCATEDQSQTAQDNRSLRSDEAVQAGETLPPDDDLYSPRDYTSDYNDWSY